MPLVLFCQLLYCQDQASGARQNQPTGGTKAQISRIHKLEDGGPAVIRELSEFLKDPEPSVRVAATKAIVRIGTQRSIDPLITATRDSDSEVRIRATDGIVNVYSPGYLTENSLSGYITRGMRHVKSFFSTRNDLIIDADVKVRDDAGQAIADEIETGTEKEPRSNAALAAGILRDKAAVPALLKAVHLPDSDLIFECLVALQKIHDPSAGPGIAFLARDSDERVQTTALETIGVLHAVEAAPDVRYALSNGKNAHVRRAALSSLAMLGVAGDRETFKSYAMNGDAELRTAALEGLGRLRVPEDVPTLQTSYDEANADWRVHAAAAFALVNEGNVSTQEFSPLLYLVENLNSGNRARTANTYLAELIRREEVRKNIVNTLAGATKAQKVELCAIFGNSHSEDLMPVLNNLSKDSDGDVAMAATRAAHILRTPGPS